MVQDMLGLKPFLLSTESETEAKEENLSMLGDWPGTKNSPAWVPLFLYSCGSHQSEVSYSWEAIWAMKDPNSLSYRQIKAGKVVLGSDSSSGTNCESVDAILTVAGGCPVISDIQDVF